ncbi:hypothetical protein GGD66_005672 [Bradyrhizobium sp. CIR48]|uniref:hypothetical protein n=1 Tax=Bradyrhizobium sp. CIR48 TaxID=2663840 RepID=UPI00160671E6|nr:hypothetical protein [Bradyrhizobium sp. CIR48]MBB4427096.1 hypothetical protein [Bradyrhizobium sp. CIR48]
MNSVIAIEHHAVGNTTFGRYPLKEEYRALRLGKYPEENDILWATAKWFEGIYSAANRDAAATPSPFYASVGELGGFKNKELPDAMGSSDPLGQQVERFPIPLRGEVLPSLIKPNVRRADSLYMAEERIYARQVCQHVKWRLDCSYRHLVNAVVYQWEMKDIGADERFPNAATGRALVRAALRTTSLVRSDLARWDAMSERGERHAVGPLPDKLVYSAQHRKAANDDMRHIRDVA